MEQAFTYMAKFPMVTIEKFQGPCAAKSMPPSDTCHQEEIIIDVLRRVKAVNSNVCTIFYMNSILNFPQYDLSESFVSKHAALFLHDSIGTLIGGGGGGKGGVAGVAQGRRGGAGPGAGPSRVRSARTSRSTRHPAKDSSCRSTST